MNKAHMHASNLGSNDGRSVHLTPEQTLHLRARVEAVPRSTFGRATGVSPEGEHLAAMLAELHQAGVTSDELGAALGLGPQRVYQLIRMAEHATNDLEPPEEPCSSRGVNETKPVRATSLTQTKRDESAISLEWIAQRINAFVRLNPEFSVELKVTLRRDV